MPNFLNDMGVNVIISGGMGGGAIDIFNEKSIDVIVGTRGNAKAAAEAYLQGSLKSTGSVCMNISITMNAADEMLCGIVYSQAKPYSLAIHYLIERKNAHSHFKPKKLFP